MHPHEIYSEKKMKTKKKNHHHSCSNCLEIFLAFCKSSFSWRHMRNGPAVESTWYVKGEQSLQSLIYQMAWGAAVPSLSQCWRRTEKTKQETACLSQSQKGRENSSMHNEGFNLPHASCWCFTGPERKAKVRFCTIYYKVQPEGSGFLSLILLQCLMKIKITISSFSLKQDTLKWNG